MKKNVTLALSLAAGIAQSINLRAADPVDFVKQIKPVFEANCVACHKEGHAKGGLNLENKAKAFTSENGPVIVPGKSKESKLYKVTTLAADDDDLMPPAKKGGPLPKNLIELLRDWIDQGANWPDGVTLTQKKEEVANNTDDEPATVASIREKILANQKEKTQAEMKAYSDGVQGTGVSFDLVPIPAGEYTMGSPASEPGRKADEGPQHKVSISPFWMGKCEVTWNEFELFMYPDEEKKRITSNGSVYSDALSDAVSRPTKPYVEMSFGMGRDGFPAISMTQHMANKYCEWLSARTGHYYRLPTEAEWEYACRAGTTTAYSFGDDPAQLDDYAWYTKNSDSKYQKVGKKKPNPWGLYDMHGNVAEWVIDQYEPNYDKYVGSMAKDPWTPSTKPYPHAVRGGSWDDEPDKLRSSARRGSDKSWKMQDPQLPKSIWFHTDAQFLGFRIVRPLEVPPAEVLSKFWNNGVEWDAGKP
ncbi:MAG TPA: SUMF1/EgtB/PvdO family nonheme iron enzyme [Verrucomicrobiae bacterium]|nr:SUMF1/EgtB/PvdO family nonheme iron enzyme [Verrucomicrobiae bacterium]